MDVYTCLDVSFKITLAFILYTSIHNTFKIVTKKKIAVSADNNMSTIARVSPLYQINILEKIHVHDPTFGSHNWSVKNKNFLK